MKRNLLFSSIVIACISSLSAHGQYFQGEVDYVSSYLDIHSGTPLFEGVPETVTIKGPKYKIKLDHAEAGAMDWNIIDFAKNVAYIRYNTSNSTIPTYTQPPEIKDGKLVSFGTSENNKNKVDTILKGTACTANDDTSISLQAIDTSFVIGGFKSRVVVMKRNGIRVADYYYCDSIHIDPAQYNCNRADRLDKLYRFTKGSLITQIVQYDEMFTYVYQIKSVRHMTVNDAAFDLPKGVPVVERK